MHCVVINGKCVNFFLYIKQLTAEATAVVMSGFTGTKEKKYIWGAPPGDVGCRYAVRD